MSGGRGQRAHSPSSAPGSENTRIEAGAAKEPEQWCQAWGPRLQPFDRNFPISKPPPAAPGQLLRSSLVNPPLRPGSLPSLQAKLAPAAPQTVQAHGHTIPPPRKALSCSFYKLGFLLSPRSQSGYLTKIVAPFSHSLSPSSI